MCDSTLNQPFPIPTEALDFSVSFEDPLLVEEIERIVVSRRPNLNCFKCVYSSVIAFFSLINLFCQNLGTWATPELVQIASDVFSCIKNEHLKCVREHRNTLGAENICVDHVGTFVNIVEEKVIQVRREEYWVAPADFLYSAVYFVCHVRTLLVNCQCNCLTITNQNVETNEVENNE